MLKTLSLIIFSRKVKIDFQHTFNGETIAFYQFLLGRAVVIYLNAIQILQNTFINKVS